MNRNSFSGIRALNVIVFLFFASVAFFAAIGTSALVHSLVGATPGLGALLLALGLAFYAVRQAWFTAFGDQKFGLRA